MAAVALSCLPIVILELTLQFVAHPTPAIDNIDHDPFVDLHQLRPLFELDDAKGQWKISPSRYNFFQPESFPAEKSVSTRRIFVLGGSTVQGRPYSTQTSLSTWLKFRLQASAPEWNYEVINCGGVSYASYRVAKILQEVLQHQPDAIVLYTGHNEFLEDRTYAETRDQRWHSRFANTVAGKLQTVRWIKRQFVCVPDRSPIQTEVDAKLDHMGGLESYERNPTWRRSVENHFQVKLSQMVGVTVQANVPLVLCLPTSDIIDTPPIKTQLKPGLSKALRANFETELSVASDEMALASDRMIAAQACLAIDDQHCGAHYILGRLLYQAGKASAARPHLIAARDFDVCPLRATSAILDAVRRAGTSGDMMFVDTEFVLDQRGPSGQLIPDQIPDPDRFADHLHPTIAAHQIIAAEIASELAKRVWGSVEEVDDAETAYQFMVKTHLDSLGEAYFARGKQRLEGLHRWATGRAGQLGTQNETQ